MNKPLKINQIIGSGAQSRLFAQARLLMDLELQLQRLLPAQLQAHCHILAVNGMTLVLATDSPAWAVRLRFHTHQLVKQLSLPRTVKLRTIRIRVRPTQKAAPVTRQPEYRPARNRIGDQLRRASQTVSDRGVKTALLKQASRSDNP